MLRLLRFLALLVPGVVLALMAGGHSLFFLLAVLAATGVSMWLDGTRPSFRWAQLGIGFGAGALLFSLIAVVQAWAVGAAFQFRLIPAALAGGLVMMLLSVLFEELLFRGYLFDRLHTLGGAPLALGVTSLLFGAYHLIGRPYWAMGAVFVFVLPALGGLLFGYARLSSGSLALPIGLHWGGNWATASLFGWGTGGSALWTAEITPAQAHALTAPDLLPHLPYLTALAVMAVLVRFRFSAQRYAWEKS
ncbi:CPBP family intramembrane glutamic endopeptidase [Longispora albida]|uniref:CPBP family intramembrane glutamic endopeptidase n=1 Tax=Longispora albida TaxID=203523 RepID=UPI0003639693|nr:CPBP family intramembrane glutamic endopeptidase [Longispora albida]